MSIQKLNVRNSVLLILILVAVSFRFVDLGESYSWANFTPVGAIALFAGTYFNDKVKAFIVPLAVLFLSDVLLQHKYTGEWNPIYPGIIYTYFSFAAMVIIGMMIRKVSVWSVFGAALAGVAIHWLLTDIQPWLTLPQYSKDLSGYIQALIAAIPFERALLLGNLFFGALLYGAFEFSKSKYPQLELSVEYN